MIDTDWISEVLLDMAAFAVEYDLPETYEALIKAMAVATTETQQKGRVTQRISDNVIPMLKRANVKFALP